MKIAVLAGDGIGKEIMVQALRVLEVLKTEGMPFEFVHAPLGGQAYDEYVTLILNLRKKSVAMPMRCCLARLAARNTTT